MNSSDRSSVQGLALRADRFAKQLVSTDLGNLKRVLAVGLFGTTQLGNPERLLPKVILTRMMKCCTSCAMTITFVPSGSAGRHASGR